VIEGVPRNREKVCIRETEIHYPIKKMSSSSDKKEEKFFVYILQSMRDFSFYVGQCDDLDRRMSKHFDGLSKYTASKRPWRLVYFEMVASRSGALKREKEIKSKKSRKYIETLISHWRND